MAFDRVVGFDQLADPREKLPTEVFREIEQIVWDPLVVRPQDFGVVADGGEDDRDNLALADAEAVSLGYELVFKPGTYRVGSDLTLSALVVMMAGAVLLPDDGVVVKLKGGIDAPSGVQIFDTSSGGRVAPSTHALHVKWWGAVGDDLTQDRPAIQACLDTVPDIALASVFGQRVKVIIPPGTYKCGDGIGGIMNNLLLPKSNTEIENQGHLKFYGGNNVGGFVAILAEQNIEIHGGVWDSNSQGNDNCIAMGYLSVTVYPQVPLNGELVENIWVHDMVIQNARQDISGFSEDDPLDPVNVGYGGGKGITVQNGCKNILIDNVIIDNCDIGISVEGIELFDPPGCSESVMISNSIIKNSRWMGFFVSTSPSVVGHVGKNTGIALSNVEFVDCAIGQTSEIVPRDIGDLFGVISTRPMQGVTGTNIRVRSTEGRMTVFYGPMRDCHWDVQVFAGGEMIDFINSGPYGGAGPSTVTSRYNVIKAQIAVLGTTFDGYFINSHATATASFSRYEIDAIWWNNNSPVSSFATARYSNNLPSTSTLQVTDLHTGQRKMWDGTREVVTYDNTNGVRFPNSRYNEKPLIFGTGGTNRRWLHYDTTFGLFRAHTSAPGAETTGANLAFQDAGSAADGDTTPSVLGVSQLTTANTTPTTITNFDDGYNPQLVTILFTDSNTTLAHNSTIKLRGEASKIFTAGGTLTLVRKSGVWYEIGCSDRNLAIHLLDLGSSGTTISEDGAGDVAIENNRVYRAGGTDVPVTDGGTGRSTGSTAYGTIHAGTTATGAQQTVAPGATDEVFTGGGGSALPAWTNFLAFLAARTHAATSKTTPVDADQLFLVDSAASDGPRQLTIANLKLLIFNYIVGAAPGTMDTLDEIAASLADNADFAGTMTTLLALKAPLASPALTGSPTINGETPITSVDYDILTSGEPIFPRRHINQANCSVAAGTMRVSYFTARKTESITKIRTLTGGTNSSGATLCRIGVYSVDGSGNLTLIHSSTNDTTLWDTINTSYSKALSTTFSKVRGTRYAIGFLCVGASPTVNGWNIGTVAAEFLRDPSQCANLAGQSDLPASVAVGSLTATSINLYAACEP